MKIILILKREKTSVSNKKNIRMRLIYGLKSFINLFVILELSYSKTMLIFFKSTILE